MFENCTPRGRWLRARYIKPISAHDKKLYIYEVISVGTGVTDITVGEQVVVVSPEQVVELENHNAFIWRDYVIATWNDIIGIANPVAPYMRGHRLYATTKPGSNWNSDAMIVNVTDSPAEVGDIAVGDNVVVPLRFAWLAGPSMDGVYIFHPDHVVGKCP